MVFDMGDYKHMIGYNKGLKIKRVERNSTLKEGGW